MASVDTVLHAGNGCYSREFFSELCEAYDDQVAEGRVDEEALLERARQVEPAAATALEEALRETSDAVEVLAAMRELGVDGLASRQEELIYAAEASDGHAEEGDETEGDETEGEPVSLDDLPWITTLTEAETFEAWLTRVGVDAELVDSLAALGDSSGDTTEPVEAEPTDLEPADLESAEGMVPLDELPWIATLTEAATFEEWLTRVGVDAATVAALFTSETPT